MNRFRNSLATRVVVSTVLLSLAAFWLAGSALFNNLSSGVKRVKTESAISEFRATSFGLQYEFILANANDKLIQKAIDDVAKAATLTGSQELAVVASPNTNLSKSNFSKQTDYANLKLIPKNLQKKVQKSSGIKWDYATNGKSIIVGEKIRIPNNGNYELYVFYSLANQEATNSLILNALLLTGLALLFLIALTTWLVVRQVVSPVREAARTAEQLTAGDLGQRMEVEGEDELARLGNAFNEMADSLQKQITRLENLSLVQQRFVSDVSHELRTPLTTIRLASAVIDGAKESFEPTVARSAQLLMSQLDRFERLLEDLLEISRFDAEVAVLEAIDFDLGSMIKNVVDELQFPARELQTEIRYSQPMQPVVIKADIRRVSRILRNLLSNAIDHSNGKPVEVNLVHNENTVAIGVRDFGEGFDKDVARRVFDRFWRADPSRSRVHGGTGLGLSISLEDARLHNGELEAFAEPNKGAHFVLTLPRKAGDEISGRLIKLQY